MLIPLLFICLGLLLVGLGFLGSVPENLTRDEFLNRMSWCGGAIAGFGVVIGLVFVTLWGLQRRFGLAAYEDGLEVVKRNSVKRIPWSEFSRVTVSSFSGGHGLKPQLFLHARYGKRSAVNWASSFEGNVEGVFQAFMTRCHYIVENPEGYNK
ncbi:hypothetical protein [Stieleria varia]|uniref:hypothetical protein n=1 Tax=Stieleria varia TaxID=2528005 RepID=UPI001E4B471D|nr:hypothetical protein [Stieleria varia]